MSNIHWKTKERIEQERLQREQERQEIEARRQRIKQSKGKNRNMNEINAILDDIIEELGL